MYHRIVNKGAAGRYTVSVSNFAKQMRHLSEANFKVIDFKTLTNWFGGNAVLPDRSIIITFDDGFLDTYEHAAPVLKEFGLHATVFIVAGLTGQTSNWMTSPGVPSSQLMDWREIENLKRDGFEVGSHTVTHPSLIEISLDEAKDEIYTSKMILEDRLGVPVSYFAYPYGRFDHRIRDAVQAIGYEAACSTLTGFVNKDNDLYALRRIEVFGDDSLRVFRRKLQFGTNEMRPSAVFDYYTNRFVAKYFRSTKQF